MASPLFTFAYFAFTPALLELDRRSLYNLVVASSLGSIFNLTCSLSLAFRRSTMSNSTESSTILIDSLSISKEPSSISEQIDRFLLRLVPVHSLANFAAVTSPTESSATRLRASYESTNLLPSAFPYSRP